MNDKISIRIRNGYLVATVSDDTDYPGIDVEFVADNDKGEDCSRPRVLIEAPMDDTKLRALCWADKNNEDYTEEVVLHYFDGSNCVDDCPISDDLLGYIAEHNDDPEDYLYAISSEAKRDLSAEELFDYVNEAFGYKYSREELMNIAETVFEETRDEDDE